MQLSKARPGLSLVAGLFFSCSISSFAWSKPAQLVFNPAQGSVGFKALGNPSALVINGEGPGPSGELKVSDEKTIEGALSFDLKTLKTGLGLRDRHMRDKYLEVEKFPEAKFTPTLVPWKDPSLAAQETVSGAPFSGKLTLHGVEAPVEGTMNAKPAAGGKVDCEFTFKIKMADFKIDTPKFAEITVAENVDVVVKAQAEVKAL